MSLSLAASSIAAPEHGTFKDDQLYDKTVSVYAATVEFWRNYAAQVVD